MTVAAVPLIRAGVVKLLPVWSIDPPVALSYHRASPLETVAVKVAVSPAQTGAGLAAVAVGIGFTVMVTTLLSLWVHTPDLTILLKEVV